MTRLPPIKRLDPCCGQRISPPLIKGMFLIGLNDFGSVDHHKTEF